MTETLQRWLSNKLKEDIKWGSNEFSKATKDGVAVASILQCHNLVSDDDQYLITKTNDNKEMRHNWNQIRTWLDNLDIDLSEEDMENILAGEEPSILRLFYKIFLCLDKMVRTDFINKAQLRMLPLSQNIRTTKTDIEKVEAKPKVDCCNNSALTKWQNRKAEELNKTYDQIRTDLIRKVVTTERDKSVKTNLENAIKNSSSYDYLTEQNHNEISEINNKALQLGWQNYDAMWLKDFLKHLQHKITIQEEDQNLLRYAQKNTKENFVENNEEVSYNLTQSKLNKKLCENIIETPNKKDADNICNYDENDETQGENSEIELRNVRLESIKAKSIDKEELDMDRSIPRKVLRLSQFEKQICRIFLETKHQAHSLLKKKFEDNVKKTNLKKVKD